MKRKVISMFLAAAVTVSSVPFSAFAEEQEIPVTVDVTEEAVQAEAAEEAVQAEAVDVAEAVEVADAVTELPVAEEDAVDTLEEETPDVSEEEIAGDEELLVEPESEDELAELLEDSLLDAVEVVELEEGENTSEDLYVLMNIPYSEFYAADGVSAVDAVSSATKSKTRTGSLAGGSYHVNNDGSDITGITFPVLVSADDVDALEGYKQITDEDSVTIEVTNRGQTSSTTYEGPDALFEAESHAYYILSEEPSYYKEMSVDGDGNLSFGEVVGNVVNTEATAEITTVTTYGDYQVSISGLDIDISSDKVYGVVVTTSDGKSYGLRHVENIWRGTELAWSTGHTTTVHGCNVSYANYADMEGETISQITYYTSKGIYKISTALYAAPYFVGFSAEIKDTKTIAVSGLPEDMEDAAATVSYTVGSGRNSQTVIVAENAAITDGTVALDKELAFGTTYTVTVTSSNYAVASDTVEVAEGYILMNIPYDRFYAADGASAVDAVSSATKSKTRTGSLAGGSYHVNSDGSDITGITFPVLVSADDMDALEGYRRITDEDFVIIEVTNRGQTSTTKYEGPDALFEADSYAYYILSEVPSYYKEMSVSEDGSISFGAVVGETVNTEATAEITTVTTYGDYQVSISDLDIDISSDKVYGVVVTTTDGKSYGLRHVENIWRGTELAWSTGHTTTVHGCNVSYENYADMEGETISQITYYTSKGIYKISTDLYAAPYFEGFSAEIKDTKTIAVSGLPADMKDAAATVSYTVGSGRNSQTVIVAENAAITDGTVALDKALAFGTTYTVTVTSSNYAVASDTVEVAEGYILMNIPYDRFYAADGASAVDAVSSATKSKTRTGSLAGGSYHVNSDGSDITGITFPVRLTAEALKALSGYRQITDEDFVTIEVTNRGQTSTTKYEGPDALFEADSYAYYILSEVPSYYKEMSVGEDGSLSFGAVVGETVNTEATAEITTVTTYGDYQVSISDLDIDISSDKVYGVVVTTSDGKSYGLRHVENIWRGTELAWSTGHTTTVHGSNVSYENYADMEGETISQITYYTSKGIYKISTALYAAPYFVGFSAEIKDTKTIAVSGLPEDMEDATATVSYTVGSGRNSQTVIVAENAAITDGTVALNKELAFGTTYTVTVTSSNYAVASDTVEVAEGYILMNIPYDRFYAADGASAVDAVSSATKTKTRTGNLAGGSYHVNSDGSDITGITFPVRLTAEALKALSGYRKITDEDSVTIEVTNRGQTSTTTYKGPDALFEADSYAYYILSEEPSYYKEMSVSEDGSLSFGAVVGEAIDTEATAEITTVTTYGDYQVSISDLDIDISSDKVYGVVVTTTDGKSYGLRHVENIWRGTELAWSTGHTTTVHGSNVSYANYADMEGKTISQIIYYTSKGIFKINTSLKMNPYYSGKVSAKAISAKTVAISGLPADISEAVVTVSYTEGSGHNAKTEVVAENVALKDGAAVLGTALAFGKTYDITVNSKNYAVIRGELAVNDLSLTTVSLAQTSYTYNGSAAKPAVSIKGLKEGTDYTVAYSNNVNAGTATVTVTGIGAYTGTVTKTFTIAKAAAVITASDLSKKSNAKSFAIKASVTGNGALTFASGNTKIAKVNAANGTVKLVKNAAGKVTITITSAESANYKAASKTITLLVSPRKATNLKVKSTVKKQAKVTWTKRAGVTGYQIQYSTSKKFASAKTQKKSVKSVSKTSCTLKSLKSGKTYYVRIRTYKKVGGVKYFSDWSNAKKVKVK